MTDYESAIAEYFYSCGKAGVPVTKAEDLIPLAQRIRRHATSSGRADGDPRAERTDDRNRAKVGAMFADLPGYRAVITTTGLPYVVIENPAGISTAFGHPGILVPMRYP